jgi:hypothetical protein
MIIGGYKKGDISASTEVGWLALNFPVLINDGVYVGHQSTCLWETRCLHSAGCGETDLQLYVCCSARYRP